MSVPAVEAVAFDVNEPLFSLARLRPAFGAVGLDPDLVALWFARYVAAVPGSVVLVLRSEVIVRLAG